jgi:hypothetical protein
MRVSGRTPSACGSRGQQGRGRPWRSASTMDLRRQDAEAVRDSSEEDEEARWVTEIG